MTDTASAKTEVRQLDSVIVRFAGDSGDGVQLTGSRFTQEAALGGADLARAGLSGAGLSGADLSNANLKDAILLGATLNDANLKGADLAGAYLSDATFGGADLTGANLRGAKLDGADLATAIDVLIASRNFAGIIFSGCLKRPAGIHLCEQLARGNDLIHAPAIAIADVHKFN